MPGNEASKGIALVLVEILGSLLGIGILIGAVAAMTLGGIGYGVWWLYHHLTVNIH